MSPSLEASPSIPVKQSNPPKIQKGACENVVFQNLRDNHQPSSSPSSSSSSCSLILHIIFAFRLQFVEWLYFQTHADFLLSPSPLLDFPQSYPCCRPKSRRSTCAAAFSTAETQTSWSTTATWHDMCISSLDPENEALPDSTICDFYSRCFPSMMGIFHCHSWLLDVTLLGEARGGYPI